VKTMGIAAAVVAVAMGVFAWLLYRDVARMTSWPAAAGVVVSSELRHSLVDSSTRRRHLALMPSVRYEFEVNGRQIISNRISNKDYVQYVVSLETPPGKELQAVLARYAIGAKVTVRYNPEHPASAILEIDPSGARWCAAIAALAAVVAFIGLLRS